MRDNTRPRLLELGSDCLILILQLRVAKEFGDAITLRQRLINLFNRFERNAKQAGIEAEAVDTTKFALAAFMDETILGSEWSGKDAWLAQPLQMEFYNRFDAGEEFFKRLEQLRQRVQANAEVLEVYYTCMVLGFKGIYQFEPPEKLRTLNEDVYNELRRAAGKSANLLSPHGRPRGEIKHVVKEKVPAWVVGAAAAAIGLLFYLFMTLRISSQADAIKEAIAKII
ncbi:MAG: type IVB secretion system protein IcmH/DotU [bacterium]